MAGNKIYICACNCSSVYRGGRREAINICHDAIEIGGFACICKPCLRGEPQGGPKGVFKYNIKLVILHVNICIAYGGAAGRP
jgi:hypothetical protein